MSKYRDQHPDLRQLAAELRGTTILPEHERIARARERRAGRFANPFTIAPASGQHAEAPVPVGDAS